MESFDSVFFRLGGSLLGYKKSLNLFNELHSVKGLEGSTAEIGVFKGFTSKLIHIIANDKVHYAYDTFCGIQGSDPTIDYHTNGEFSCGLDDVKSNIGMDNIVYRVGYFPDTFQEQSEKFMFVHSDTDTYIGTKTTIECFAPRMVSGGKIMFDDYQWKNCPGVEKAVSEFMNNNNEFTIRVYDNTYYNHHDTTYINQCVLTKN
jgi:O-methyltransferase